MFGKTPILVVAHARRLRNDAVGKSFTGKAHTELELFLHRVTEAKKIVASPKKLLKVIFFRKKLEPLPFFSRS